MEETLARLIDEFFWRDAPEDYVDAYPTREDGYEHTLDNLDLILKTRFWRDFEPSIMDEVTEDAFAAMIAAIREYTKE